MMIDNIPLFPLPYKSKLVKKTVHGFYPLSSIMLKFFPSLEQDLEESGGKISAKEYLGGGHSLVCFLFHFDILHSSHVCIPE